MWCCLGDRNFLLTKVSSNCWMEHGDSMLWTSCTLDLTGCEYCALLLFTLLPFIWSFVYIKSVSLLVFIELSYKALTVSDNVLQNKVTEKFKRPLKKRHSSVYHQPTNRVNKFLAQAIDARSVHREKATHVHLLTLCFKDTAKEAQVTI